MQMPAVYWPHCTPISVLKFNRPTGSVLMVVGAAVVMLAHINSPQLPMKVKTTIVAIQYVLEGNVNYAGALLDWMAANLELAPDREHILALAHQVSDSDGVYLIPAFSGLGAPYWNSSVRTQLSGMTLNTRKCHISCAAEQSIAYQVTDVIRAARAVFSGIKTLRADSSLAQDAPLLQFQSDLLRTPITASAMPESPGAGVAFTAGLTVGLYTPEQLENTCSAKRYEPQMRDTQVAALYAGWCNAVSHMLSQPTT